MSTLSHPEVLEIPGLTTEGELRFLEMLCRRAPQNGRFLELGTFNGRSTALLCLAGGKKRRVVSIDNYKMKHHGENTAEVARQNLARYGLRAILLQGETTDPFAEFAGPLQTSLLFIDSHHHPVTFLREMDIFRPQLEPGAIVAVHDVGRKQEYPGFTEAVLDYFATESWQALGQMESLAAWKLEAPDGP